MPGIVIFGGTVEGRQLVEELQHTGIQLHICVATKYGASLLPKGENVHVYTKRLDQGEMEQFLLERDADGCVDATHPYASQVTENIITACENVGLPYIRVLREEGRLKEGGSKLIFMSDVSEAADYLSKAAGTIFITTGSKELEKYTVIPDYQTRCIARVLPTSSVMEKCRELGFEGKNLIGMQGPFSEEMNYCMLKQSGADWLVTKNSGKAGGYEEKCEAALRLGINILVIGRPVERSAHVVDLDDLIRYFREKCDIMKKNHLLAGAIFQNADINKNSRTVREDCQDSGRASGQRKLYLVGMGPGSSRLLTQEAVEALQRSDVLIGAARVLEIWQPYRDKPHFISYKKDDIVNYLKEHPEYRTAAVCYSGDIGFYSGAKGMWEQLQREADQSGEGEESWDICPISGISSVTYFLNLIGVPWDEVKLASCHGKQADIPLLLREHPKVCILLGEEEAVFKICEKLLEAGMPCTRITVGERLSYKEERVVTGYPADFIGQKFDKLSVLLLEADGHHA